MRALCASAFLLSGCSLLFGSGDLKGTGGNNDDFGTADLAGGGGDMTPPPDLSPFFGCGSDGGAHTTTFMTANYPAGTGSYDSNTGDFDGDGFIDIAVSNQGSNNVSILWNLKDGTFSAPMQLATPNGPREIVVADFNNDQKLDIAVACNDGGSPEVDLLTVLINNGSRAFAAHKDFPTTPGTSSLTAVDITKDGKTDIVTLSNSGDTVRLFVNNGTATLFPTTGLIDSNVCPQVGKCFNQGVAGAYGISSGDFNHDGWNDIVTANYSDGSMSILLNDMTGHFPQTTNVKSYPVGPNPGTAPADVVVHDFNNDGKPDLVFATVSYNAVIVAINDGSGGFPQAGQQNYDAGMTKDTMGMDALVEPNAVGVADFNGDGLIDIVAAGNNLTGTNLVQPDLITIFFGRPGGTFTTPAMTLTGVNAANAVRVADFNNDCKPDFLVDDDVNSGAAYVFLNTSN
jgi:hypothetical protein